MDCLQFDVQIQYIFFWWITNITDRCCQDSYMGFNHTDNEIEAWDPGTFYVYELRSIAIIDS